MNLATLIVRIIINTEPLTIDNMTVKVSLLAFLSNILTIDKKTRLNNIVGYNRLGLNNIMKVLLVYFYKYSKNNLMYYNTT